jgi:hypothetical protein
MSVISAVHDGAAFVGHGRRVARSVFSGARNRLMQPWISDSLWSALSVSIRSMRAAQASTRPTSTRSPPREQLSRTTSPAALGTPVVGLYGPTDAARNGPWCTADVVVSRCESCACHDRRRCHRGDWCLADITPDVQRRARVGQW